MMMGNRYQEGMVTLLPDSPSARLPPQHSSASPSFSSPASHSHSVPCPGLWGDAEGTGSGLALRVSREHKVGQRQKRFLGSPQKTRCDEAAVNTSDLNSPATGMKLRMPQGSEASQTLENWKLYKEEGKLWNWLDWHEPSQVNNAANSRDKNSKALKHSLSDSSFSLFLRKLFSVIFQTSQNQKSILRINT